MKILKTVAIVIVLLAGFVYSQGKGLQLLVKQRFLFGPMYDVMNLNLSPIDYKHIEFK